MWLQLRQLWCFATIVIGVATIVVDSDNCGHSDNCDHIIPPTPTQLAILYIPQHCSCIIAPP